MLTSALVEIGLSGEEVVKCEVFLQSNEGVEAVLRTVDLVHSMGTHTDYVITLSCRPCTQTSCTQTQMQKHLYTAADYDFLIPYLLVLLTVPVHVIFACVGVHSIPTLVVDGGAFVHDGATRAEDIVASLRQITQNSDTYVPRPRLFKESMIF